MGFHRYFTWFRRYICGELLSLVVVNLFILFQILENDQSTVTYFMQEIDKIRLKQTLPIVYKQ